MGSAMKRVFLTPWILAAISLLVGSLAAGEQLLAVDWSPTDALIYRLDAETGDPQALGAAGFGGLNALARHPDGTFYSVDAAGALLTIDPDTGTGTPVTTINLGGPAVNMPGLAFTPGGSLYAINNGVPEDELYVIDVGTGTGLLVGPTGRTTLQALTFGPDGTLYGWDVATGVAGGLCTLDPITGAATDVNPAVGADEEIQCLTFAPDGALYGAHRDIYTINPATGKLTLIVAMGGVGIRGMEFLVTPPLRLRLLQQGPEAVLCWFTETNRVYQVQQRNNLGPITDWNPVGPPVPGTGEEVCLTNSFPASQSFFRLRAAPIPAEP
jgi:hypothetical protein